MQTRRVPSSLFPWLVPRMPTAPAELPAVRERESGAKSEREEAAALAAAVRIVVVNVTEGHSHRHPVQDPGGGWCQSGAQTLEAEWLLPRGGFQPLAAT